METSEIRGVLEAAANSILSRDRAHADDRIVLSTIYDRWIDADLSDAGAVIRSSKYRAQISGPASENMEQRIVFTVFVNGHKKVAEFEARKVSKEYNTTDNFSVRSIEVVLLRPEVTSGAELQKAIGRLFGADADCRILDVRKEKPAVCVWGWL
ncbi:MAG: hypothetical protein IJ523_10040 [Succinivibrionaceae bacterium]|nr:hypothetical protein [Succinivibrionaceae bacterium]